MDDFVDHFVSREQRFSLGLQTSTGRFFLSTPVSGVNRAVECEAYFEISREEFERYRATPAAAAGLLDRCRNRQEQDRLLKALGTHTNGG